MRFPLLPAAVLACAAIASASAQDTWAYAFSDPGAFDPQEQQEFFFQSFQPGAPYLGVQLGDVTADRAATLKLGDARGVEIKHVGDGTPAQQAGLKEGDVLLTYNGENILGARQLGRLVSETPVGRKIKVQYWRNGKTESAVVTVGAAPNAPGVHTAVDWPMSMATWAKDAQMHVDMNSFDFPKPLMLWTNQMLGIECEALDTQLAQYFGVKRGTLVRSVTKGSAADKAGLKAGDVLTSIGHEDVTAPRDVTAYLRSRSHEAHQSIPVELVRDHKPLTINVPITEAPEE